MTEFSLVRHGETDWNRAKRIQGTTDIPLNDEGRAQARVTGVLVARRQWDAVYTSPLSRARETAEIIAAEAGLPEPIVIPDLAERDYGDAEGMDWREIESRFPDGVAVPGQETREQVAVRVRGALAQIAEAHPDGRFLAVTHGGVIRGVLQAAEPESRYGMIANGSVHSFRWSNGALSLVAFDDPVETLDAATAGDPAADVDAQNALEAREDGAAV